MSKQICVSLNDIVSGMLSELVESSELPNGSRMYSSKSAFISSVIMERYDQFIIERAWYVCDHTLDGFIEACCKLDSYSNFKSRNRRFFELYFDGLSRYGNFYLQN